MREPKKKNEAEVLLAAAKPAGKAEASKAGRDPGGAGKVTPALENEEFNLMKKRLAAAQGGEKRGILAEIQRRFGNEKAAQVVKELRLLEDDAMVSRPKAKAPGMDKA